MYSLAMVSPALRAQPRLRPWVKASHACVIGALEKSNPGSTGPTVPDGLMILAKPRALVRGMPAYAVVDLVMAHRAALKSRVPPFELRHHTAVAVPHKGLRVERVAPSLRRRRRSRVPVCGDKAIKRRVRASLGTPPARLSLHSARTGACAYMRPRLDGAGSRGALEARARGGG